MRAWPWASRMRAMMEPLTPCRLMGARSGSKPRPSSDTVMVTPSASLRSAAVRMMGPRSGPAAWVRELRRASAAASMSAWAVSCGRFRFLVIESEMTTSSPPIARSLRVRAASSSEERTGASGSEERTDDSSGSAAAVSRSARASRAPARSWAVSVDSVGITLRTDRMRSWMKLSARRRTRAREASVCRRMRRARRRASASSRA